MDADLQNDPTDIPQFLKKIEEGYDVVSGWRKDRKDKLFLRKIPSWIANSIIATITDVHIHDYGCSMKAYRREIIQEVILYGEMHRFIPAYASWHGGRVTEIVVNHRPRTSGYSKYGVGNRLWRGIADCIALRWYRRRCVRAERCAGELRPERGLNELASVVQGGVGPGLDRGAASPS